MELRKFRKKLQAGKIELKVINPEWESAEEVFRVVDRNREYLSRWLPWVKHNTTPEDSLKFLQDSYNEFENRVKATYGIFLEREYAGHIGLVSFDTTSRSAELGYWISEHLRSQGIIPNSVKILEKELFERFGFDRVHIRCDDRNEASGRVAQKCGYTLQYLVEENEYIESEDIFKKTRVYTKLRHEYFMK
ncbi:MAG: GNAT family N-acetyltransferase [Candidatus Woesearchaeota archaeon]